MKSKIATTVVVARIMLTALAVVPSCTFQAQLVTTASDDLTVGGLVGTRATPTPGNVGICLSGGGSRALSAGMGQLRALRHLKTEDGLSLLAQTKAISTVSGGSWIGVRFESMACNAFSEKLPIL